LGPPNCRGGYNPDFGHMFKSHSFPSMWPVLVEFRSARSEGSRRKKKKIEEESDKNLKLMTDER